MRGGRVSDTEKGVDGRPSPTVADIVLVPRGAGSAVPKRGRRRPTFADRWRYGISTEGGSANQLRPTVPNPALVAKGEVDDSTFINPVRI